MVLPIETEERQVQVVNAHVSRIARRIEIGPSKAILDEPNRSTDPLYLGLAELELIGLAEREPRIPSTDETLSGSGVERETPFGWSTAARDDRNGNQGDAAHHAASSCSEALSPI
jgi:hypothetical protein